MKDILSALRDYLVELVSGYFNIAFLFLDFLGVLLFFWPDFRWAQITGITIFVFSFGAANFHIYWRQRRLLRSGEDQRAKRLHILRLLLNEMQANVTSANSRELPELSDDIWQHNRADVYWLPAELQKQLSTHYRALHLLMSAVRDGIEKGWFHYGIRALISSPEITVWRTRLGISKKSLVESFQQLPETLQEQIERLEKDKRG